VLQALVVVSQAIWAKKMGKNYAQVQVQDGKRSLEGGENGGQCNFYRNRKGIDINFN